MRMDLGKSGVRVMGTWSSSTAYEKNDIVTDGGDGYISITDVPVGTALSNTAYWLKIVNGFSADEVTEAVNAWLVAHPEATTTIQDGAVTTAKIADGAVTDAKLASGGVLEDVGVLDDIVSFKQDALIPFVVADTGYINYTNGTVVTSTNFSYTDYINVERYSEIAYKRSKSTSANPSTGIAFYNADKQYVAGVQSAVSQPSAGYESDLYSISIPENAVFVRFSLYTDTTSYGEFEAKGESKLTVAVNEYKQYISNVDETFSVVGNGYTVIHTPIIKDVQYIFTNNTSATCALALVKADGTGTTLSPNVKVGRDIIFTPDADGIGIKVYCNEAGSLRLRNVYTELSNSDVDLIESLKGLNVEFSCNLNAIDGQYIYPILLLKDEEYTYTNNSGASQTLRLYNDGTSVQVISSNLANGASITFKPDQDVNGIGGYFNTYTVSFALTSEGVLVTPMSVRAQSFNSAFHTGATEFATKCKEFSSLLLGDTINNVSAPVDFESFLFFTDPHLLEGTGWENKCCEFVSQIQKYYNSTPTTFCLCGGDWIGNSDLPADACFKMGYVDGFMNSMFDNVYMLVGNHDTNYQGKKDSGSATGTTRLSNQSIVDLWYRKTKKAYYAFDGANTKFYCFDAGTEDQSLTAYNNYGWEQVAWFANSLLSDNSPHIAIGTHILYSVGTTIQPLTDKILAIADAYNNRTTITANGVAYDYTNSTGNVEFLIAGHKHVDADYVVHNIPCILTANVCKDESLGATFDLVFADYDNRQIKLLRVGSGSDRTIAI